jgi:signal transduction histidine kinase
MLLLWGIFVGLIGVVIYRANKLRAANRYFGFYMLGTSAWIMNHHFVLQGGPHVLIHLRIGPALASFFPAAIGMVREAILDNKVSFPALLRTSTPWLIVGVALAVPTCTQWFLPFGPGIDTPHYGLGYVMQHVGLAAAMLYQAWLGGRGLKRVTGPRRTELIAAVIIMAVCVGAISILMASRSWVSYDKSFPVIVIVFGYILWLAWAIAGRQIYDAKYLLSLAIQAVAVLLATAAAFISAETLLIRLNIWASWTPKIVACVIAAGLGMLLTRRFFRRYMALLSEDIAIFQDKVAAVIRSALNHEVAVGEVERLFAEYCGTVTAFILPETAPGRYERGKAVLDKKDFSWSEFKQVSWLTPDGLSNELMRGNALQTKAWMDAQAATLVMLASPCAHHPGVALVCGCRRSAASYTYQEIARLALMVDSAAVALAMIEASARAQKSGQLAALGLIGATVAHEIKQPLAAIRMFMTMLPNQYNDPAFRAEFFPLMPKQIAEVENTLFSFLRLGRSEETINPVPFCANEIALEVVKLIQPKARENEVEVTTCFDLEDTIFADPQVLKKALLNLGLNAIQAMAKAPAPRQLRIAIGSGAGRVFISVRDTGPGLPEHLVEKIFQPFVTSKSDGCGLGLYITKQELARIGGEITARNRREGGASLEISFPAYVPPLSAGADRVAAPEVLAKSV